MEEMAMDEKLKNLDEKMNGTILKEINFSEEQKQRILKQINYSGKKRKSPWFVHKYIPATISVVMIILFFIGMKSLMINQSVSAQYRDKKEIVERLSQTFKPVHTVVGQFENRMSNGDKANTITFTLNLDKELYKSSEKVWTDDGYQTINILWKDGKLIYKNSTIGISEEKNLTKQEFIESGYLGSIFEGRKYISLLENYNNWKYKEVERFGRVLYQIEGKQPDNTHFPKKDAFALTVDKETGIILYLALYDQNGMSKVIIDTIDIWINKEVPDDIFQLF